MTDKELKKLKKIDLINILISQDRQIEALEEKIKANARKTLVYEKIVEHYLLYDLTEEEQKLFLEVQDYSQK